jgi:ABC-type transport system involved in cytochrome bd biosynthesis fused ATPase/permease subunit
MHASHLEILEWQDGAIPLVSLVTFGIYVAIHGGAALTPGLAFTVLALFSILIRVYAIAPQGVQTASEALVAIQRMQRLLDLPDGNGFSSPTEAAAVSQFCTFKSGMKSSYFAIHHCFLERLTSVILCSASFLVLCIIVLFLPQMIES